jgi:hypothetical protein
VAEAANTITSALSERSRALELLDELHSIRHLAVALEAAVIGASREIRMNSLCDALA